MFVTQAPRCGGDMYAVPFDSFDYEPAPTHLDLIYQRPSPHPSNLEQDLVNLVSYGSFIFLVLNIKHTQLHEQYSRYKKKTSI